jgi:beta-glucuronidase
MADRFGIAIIDQTPATSMNKALFYNQAILEHSKQVIIEMITCDRNHPSILMWSLGNEPASDLPEAEQYFSTLVNFTRPMAAGRPLTLVLSSSYKTERCIQYFDVVCANRYFGWYNQSGRLDQIHDALYREIADWRHRFPTKPFMISEYGAETVTGIHSDPPLMFTKEYQNDFLAAYHVVFDNVSSIIHPDTGYFIGELIWSAFDFASHSNIERVGSQNRKGIFTQQRQPKAAAFVLKSCYEQLESIPTDSLSF